MAERSSSNPYARLNVDPAATRPNEWQPPVEVSDSKATQDADFAAVARKSDEEWNTDYAAAKTGGRTSMDAEGDKFASELLTQPAAKYIDQRDPEGSVNRLVTAVERPGKTRKEEMLKARSASLGMVNETDPGELDMAAYVAQNGPLFDPFAYRNLPDAEVEAAALGALKDVEGNLPDGTMKEALGALVQEMVPFKGFSDFEALGDTGQRMGALDTKDRIITQVFAGYGVRKIREYINEQASTPEERAALAKQFVDLMRADLPYLQINPAALFDSEEDVFDVDSTAFSRWVNTSNVLSDEFIQTGATKQWGDIMENIASVTSMFEIGVAARIVRGIQHAGRLIPPLFRTVQATNPERAARLMTEAFNNLPDSVLKQNYNVSRADLARTQLPRPPHMVDNTEVPTIERQRLEGIREGVGDVLRNLRSNLFTREERLTLLQSTAKQIEASGPGRARPGMGKLEFASDNSFVDMTTVFGRTKNSGFTSLKAAVQKASPHIDGSDEVTFLRTLPDGSLEEFTPKLRHTPTRYRSSPRKGKYEGYLPVKDEKGSFHVQVKHRHEFTPFDDMVWSGSPVAAGSALGRAQSAVNTPSSWLRTDLMRKSTVATTSEQSLRAELDAIIAPIFELKSKDLHAVNGMMLRAEEVGRTEGRTLTRADIVADFPDASPKAIDGYFTARAYEDQLYELNNFNLWRAWSAQDYKTIGKGNSQYHGAVVELDKAPARAFDPATGKGVDLDAGTLKALRAGKAKLIRVDTEIHTDSQVFKHVIADPRKGYSLRKLSTSPLKYIPGYFTRMYADNHFIYKNFNKIDVDGKPGNFQQTMMVAPTNREAWGKIKDQLIDDEGRRLFKDWDDALPYVDKAARLRKKGIEFTVADDVRLSDVDRTAQQKQLFQVEGRLFFDDRNREPILNLAGNPAEIIDPVNTLAATSQIVARQTSLEELTQLWKGQFEAFYKNKLGADMPNLRQTESRVLAELRALAGQQGDKAKHAREAAQFWRYLMQMQGQMGSDAVAFRKVAIQTAEWVDRNLRKAGGKGVRAETKDFLGRFDLLDYPKKIAFFSLLATRPGRQLVLQSLQSLNLQALDIGYAGKWQWDTLSLLFRAKQLGASKQGRQLKTLKDNIAGKMLGYTEEETEILLKEINASGLIDQVDIHSFGPTARPKALARMPTTATERARRFAGNPISRTGTTLRKYGFDLGEQVNVTASWLMALRRHMKENGIESVKRMTRDDWVDVNNRGMQFALNMNKSNAAVWQHGALGVPLQFLQFTHKWILSSWLNALPAARKRGAGNLQISSKESMKMLAGQMFLFGGSATIFLQDHINQIVDNFEPLKGEEWYNDDIRDILKGGMLDKAFDELGRAALTPDFNVAAAEAFSPNLGIKQLLEMQYENMFENPAIGFVFGPSAQIFSKAARNYQFAKDITTPAYDHVPPAERIQRVAELMLSPFVAFMSDGVRARVMLDEGKFLNSKGQPLDPTGQTLNFDVGDFVLRAFFGANPQKLEDFYKTRQSVQEATREYETSVNDLAIALNVNIKALQLGKENELATVAKGAGYWLRHWTEHPLLNVNAMDDLQRDYANLTNDNQSLAKDLVEAIENGRISDTLVRRLQSENLALTPEQQQRALSVYENSTKYSQEIEDQVADNMINYGIELSDGERQ